MRDLFGIVKTDAASWAESRACQGHAPSRNSLESGTSLQLRQIPHGSTGRAGETVRKLDSSAKVCYRSVIPGGAERIVIQAPSHLPTC